MSQPTIRNRDARADKLHADCELLSATVIRGHLFAKDGRIGFTANWMPNARRRWAHVVLSFRGDRFAVEQVMTVKGRPVTAPKCVLEAAQAFAERAAWFYVGTAA